MGVKQTENEGVAEAVPQLSELRASRDQRGDAEISTY